MRAVAIGRRGRLEHGERLRRLAIQQERIGEIEPGGHAARIAIEHGVQTRECRVVIAAQQFECGEVGGGRAECRVQAQCGLHRLHGRADVAEAVAGVAEFEPGVGEVLARQHGCAKCRVGGLVVAAGRLGAAERVVCVGVGRRAGEGAPCCRARRLRAVERDQGGGEIGPWRGAVGRQHGGTPERGGGARGSAGGEQGDAVMQVRERLVEIEAAGAGEQR